VSRSSGQIKGSKSHRKISTTLTGKKGSESVLPTKEVASKKKKDSILSVGKGMRPCSAEGKKKKKGSGLTTISLCS